MEMKLDKSEQNNKEMLEMILQFFYENKYLESAKLLESKANILYDQNEIQQLKFLLSNHQYEESVEFLENSNFENLQKTEVLKIIKSRKFLELIKNKKIKEALDYLRTVLTPLLNDTGIINKYSVLLFQKEKELIEKLLKQNFYDIDSDDLMIKKVQSLLCLSLDSNGNRILPNSRLETLLNSYIEMDKFDVEMKDTEADSIYNIYTKSTCNKNTFKFEYHLITQKHEDEVWYMELSVSSSYLATCSRNGSIAIYRLTINKSQFKINCISFFNAHKKYITSIEWSKNENFLLSASADKTIKQWNPFEGKCLKVFLLHTDIVTSVRWLNDETFVSGGIDKKMIICTTGNRVLISECFSRIRMVLVSEALNCLIILPASINDIILYDQRNFIETNRITELDPIISSNLSKSDCGKFLITNVSKVNANINLYDLSTLTLINKYYGHTQEHYTIECSFAGENDQFIISGSEDACIYIWHRKSSIAIQVINGHTGCVNDCLLYFYNNVPLSLSVSDDYTLRIWSHIKDIIYEDNTENSHRVSDFYKSNEYIFAYDNNILDNSRSDSSEREVQESEESV